MTRKAKTSLSPVVGVKINITIFFFSLTGQERFGNMTRVGLFVLHHIHAAQVTQCCGSMGSFRLVIHMVQNHHAGEQKSH